MMAAIALQPVLLLVLSTPARKSTNVDRREKQKDIRIFAGNVERRFLNVESTGCFMQRCTNKAPVYGSLGQSMRGYFLQQAACAPRWEPHPGGPWPSAYLTAILIVGLQRHIYRAIQQLSDKLSKQNILENDSIYI